MTKSLTEKAGDTGKAAKQAVNTAKKAVDIAKKAAKVAVKTTTTAVANSNPYTAIGKKIIEEAVKDVKAVGGTVVGNMKKGEVDAGKDVEKIGSRLAEKTSLGKVAVTMKKMYDKTEKKSSEGAGKQPTDKNNNSKDGKNNKSGNNNVSESRDEGMARERGPVS